jgi:hypothetical protein
MPIPIPGGMIIVVQVTTAHWHKPTGQRLPDIVGIAVSGKS